jgi:hypothetical protein
MWLILEGDQDFVSGGGSLTGDACTEEYFCISVTTDSVKRNPP